MTPDEILEIFRRFLNASWPQVELVIGSIKQPDLWLGDWYQANWELIVEAQLCVTPKETLEIYGDGADCNSPSSRVWLPDAKPTHVIRCGAKGGEAPVDLIKGQKIPLDECSFYKFVRHVDGKYGDGSPFGHVLLEAEDEIYMADRNGLVFNVEMK